jgi:hypothetical protein
MMIESKDALLDEPLPRADTASTTLTPDERWEQWKRKGARDDARSARIVRLIGSIAAFALTIALIWALVSPR